MKRRNLNDHTLESLPGFQYVAWALIIGFSFYVYGIITNLQVAAEDLRAQSEFSYTSFGTTTQSQ